MLVSSYLLCVCLLTITCWSEAEFSSVGSPSVRLCFPLLGRMKRDERQGLRRYVRNLERNGGESERMLRTRRLPLRPSSCVRSLWDFVGSAGKKGLMDL